MAGYDPKRARGKTKPAAPAVDPVDPGEAPAPVDALLGGPTLVPPAPAPAPLIHELPEPAGAGDEPDLVDAAARLGAETAPPRSAPTPSEPPIVPERGPRWMFVAFLAAVVVLVVLRLRQRAQHA